MNGSMGCGNMVKMITHLLENLPENIAFAAICGKNEKTRKTIEKQFAKTNRVKAVGFTKDVDLYFDACDMVITKAGGLSSSEAAVKNIPIIHIDAVPGCETGNIDFFTSEGLSVTGKTYPELAALIKNLAENDETAEKIRENQREKISESAANDICEFILSRQSE